MPKKKIKRMQIGGGLYGGVPGLPNAETEEERQRNMQLAAMQQAGAPVGLPPAAIPPPGAADLPLQQSQGRYNQAVNMANPGRGLKAPTSAIGEYLSNTLLGGAAGGVANQSPAGMGAGLGAGLLATYLKRKFKDKMATGGEVDSKKIQAADKKSTPSKRVIPPPLKNQSPKPKPSKKRMASGGLVTARGMGAAVRGHSFKGTF